MSISEGLRRPVPGREGECMVVGNRVERERRKTKYARVRSAGPPIISLDFVL